MSEFTVTRTLKDPRERVWQVLTQPSHFEGWLPAKSGTAVLDVRTGGSWQATVISSEGEEIALTGRYDEVSEPDRLVMTVPGDVVTAITLTSAPNDSTWIAYTFDIDESMQTMVTESVDDVLGRVSTVLAGMV
ncbi:MAG TPA: SRPBCC domain-containing protein [Streptosporangiaceae bacterium]